MENDPMIERPIRYEHSPYGQLMAELARQSKGGPGVEKQTAALFEAILDEAELQPVLAEAADHRIGKRDLKSAAAVSAIRSAFITYFRSAIPDFNDAERLKSEDWHEPLNTLKEDLKTMDSMAIGSFLMDVTHNETNTPVAERYFTDELIGQLTKDRFPGGIRGLDIGSSIMVGALQLIHKNDFPMRFQKVRGPGGPKKSDLTRKANAIVGREAVFKEIVCVDDALIYFNERGQYDSRIQDRAISCLRPSERNNPSYIARIKALTDTKQLGTSTYDKDSPVRFHPGNLLNPIELAFFKEQHPEPFDFIMVNYLTQELPPASQLKLHSVAVDLLSENGLLVYNHQAYIHPWNTPQPASINNLHHYESFATTPFSSSMHLVDNLNPVKGIQEMMRYRDNRCQVVRLTAGRLVVNDMLVPIDDLVRHS